MTSVESRSPALLQVRQERGHRLVDLLGLLRDPLLEVLVVVPSVVPDLHKADAALDQAAGEEELLALGRVAVGRPHRIGLLFQVEGVRRGGLHLEGDLVGFEPGLEHLLMLEVP